jgi:hypothetical protein
MLIPSLAFGQYVKQGGKFLRTGTGKPIKISPYTAPEEQQGEDTAMSVVVWYEDWEDFNLIDSGIHRDTFDYYMDNFIHLGYEAVNEYADEAGIYYVDGSKVLRSFYDEGMCCLEEDDESWNEGTGVDLYMDIDDGDEWWCSFWMKLSDPFELTAGMKLQILANEISLGEPANAYTSLQVYTALDIMTAFQFSDYRYTDESPPYTTLEPNSWMCADSARQGEWINVTMRHVHNTAPDQNDARMDLFLDGVYTGWSRTGMVWSSSDPNPDDPVEWSVYNIATFMGGAELIWYASPFDQYMDTDDYVVWYPKPGIGGIPYGNQAPSGSLDITDIMPDECRIDAH